MGRCVKHNVPLFPAGFEPATLRVWGARDNHYTTETRFKEGVWSLRPLVNVDQGPVAQRITRLTTDQKIAGSNPAWIEINFSADDFWGAVFFLPFKSFCAAMTVRVN